MKDWQNISAVALWTAATIGLAGAAIADNQEPGHKMAGHGAFDMAAAFDTLDADKDGKVTVTELEAHRAARVAEADTNKDGLLSADELAQMQIKSMTERATEMAGKMIERLDTDADGLLSGSELAAGPGQAFVLDRMDADGDGAISLPEAEAAREKRGEHHGQHGGFFRGMFGGKGHL